MRRLIMSGETFARLIVTDPLDGQAEKLELSADWRAHLDVDDLRIARGLAAQYRDLKIGITDALNAVLADRYDTNEILTTDQRHFRAVTPLSRRFDAFRLLPADR
jgi:predicted nucleic acid-binding protein